MTGAQTRGERNNNPGNLNWVSTITYVGELGIEIVPAGETFKPRFARFDTAEHGIRALCVLLKVYYQRHGCDTVARVISRWAPSSENDTDAYIANVAKRMGVGSADIILLSQPETMAGLATAIIWQENGRCLYPAAMILAQAQNALGTTTPEPPRAGPPAPRSVALPPIPEPHAAIAAQPLPAPSASLWRRVADAFSKWRSS